MARIPMTTGGFKKIEEGMHILRIYAVEYNETFGNLTVYMTNAMAQTVQETYHFKGDKGAVNAPAMNAFSLFAKTAMDDFEMEDVDPDDLEGRYINCEIIHRIGKDGKTYANLGKQKEVAYGFDTQPVPEALTMTLESNRAKWNKNKKTAEAMPEPTPVAKTTTSFDLDDILG